MTILSTHRELRNAKHEEGVQFKCAQCKEVKPVQTNGGTGYGYNGRNQPVCYACCGINDKAHMQKKDRMTLYLTTRPDGGGIYGDATVTNWPGTLRFTGHYRKGSHNIARTRYDVWFKVDGENWYGVQYGDNTQIVRCRRIK